MRLVLAVTAPFLVVLFGAAEPAMAEKSTGLVCHKTGERVGGLKRPATTTAACGKGPAGMRLRPLPELDAAMAAEPGQPVWSSPPRQETRPSGDNDAYLALAESFV